MRLIDGEEIRLHAVEQVQKPPGQEALRCDIGKLEIAPEQTLFDLTLAGCIQAGIEEGRFDAELAQGLELVLPSSAAIRVTL